MYIMSTGLYDYVSMPYQAQSPNSVQITYADWNNKPPALGKPLPAGAPKYGQRYKMDRPLGNQQGVTASIGTIGQKGSGVGDKNYPVTSTYFQPAQQAEGIQPAPPSAIVW